MDILKNFYNIYIEDGMRFFYYYSRLKILKKEYKNNFDINKLKYCKQFKIKEGDCIFIGYNLFFIYESENYYLLYFKKCKVTYYNKDRSGKILEKIRYTDDSEFNNQTLKEVYINDYELFNNNKTQYSLAFNKAIKEAGYEYF